MNNLREDYLTQKFITTLRMFRTIALGLINAEEINEIKSNEKILEKIPKLSAYFSYKEKKRKLSIKVILL